MQLQASPITVLVLALLVAVLGKPAKYSSWEEYKEATGERLLKDSDNQCRNGGPIRDLCEKCSKVTKNEVVFPLCCKDGDDKGVRFWCSNFLGYKLKEKRKIFG